MADLCRKPRAKKKGSFILEVVNEVLAAVLPDSIEVKVKAKSRKATRAPPKGSRRES